MPMGKISVPKIPPRTRTQPATISDLSSAVSQVINLLDHGSGNVLAITGAGISVDSGIRAYRGVKGSESFRRRYWARSYLGYPTVRSAEPNVGHYAIAALMKMGYINHLITQNVDRLHHKAIGVKQNVNEPDYFNLHPTILELHGTLKHVNCLSCGHQLDRDGFQDLLSDLNPSWKNYAENTLGNIGQEIKTNPDGDADLRDKSFDSFVVPNCKKCSIGILKPAVTFFGESLSTETKESGSLAIQQASNLLLLGTSLTTYSAFRLVKEMKEKPHSSSNSSSKIGMINIGTTRADDLVDWKVGSNSDANITAADLGCSQVLRLVGLQLASRHALPHSHPVMRLLNKGKIQPLD